MKTSLKLFALGIVLMGFGASVNAQTSAISASGASSASVKTVLTIAAGSNDLTFGTFSGYTTKTAIVTVGYDGTRDGDADFVGTSGVSYGDFNITGEPNQAIAITLPEDGASVLSIGSADDQKMVLNTFTCSEEVGSVDLGEGGTLLIKVGASLAVKQNQLPGNYAGTYTVSINYN